MKNKTASATQTATTPDAPAMAPATAVRGRPTHSATIIRAQTFTSVSIADFKVGSLTIGAGAYMLMGSFSIE